MGLLDGIGSVLHFAPERVIAKYLRERVADYVSADLYQTDVDRRENIEDIIMRDASVDAVFCSHVLEHVNDHKALRELYRILRPGGLLIAMVPICEGWQDTYENPALRSPAARDLHFGQHDHVRYYGRDFSRRMEEAGFEVTPYTASPEDTVRYGLVRGEKVFVGRKPVTIW